MADETTKNTLVFMGTFIAEKLIEKEENGYWRLTPKGVVEANKVMEKLSHRERILMLLLTNRTIRTGKDK